MANDPITYRDAGVDIDEMNTAVLRMREHVRSTFTPQVLTDVGSFGGMFGLGLDGVSEPVLVGSIDGVGTKVRVAAAMGVHDTIGADLVAHCVNDILVQGARPLFFLDYFATGKLVQEIVVEVVKGLAAGCRTAGCALIGGETAEMPGVYQDGEYDLAGCIVGIVDRSRIIDGRSIEPGDAVIGLASAGLHTNGYSLARHVLFDSAGLSPESTPPQLAGRSVGEVLLAPHRSYAQSVLPLLDRFRVKGIAHITGGGLYENIPRILPADCSVTVDRRLWTSPPIFTYIQELGNVPDAEMYRTFNMGIGLVLIVERDETIEVMAELANAGETPSLIGEVHRGVHEVDIL